MFMASIRSGKDDAREWLERPSLSPEQKAAFMEEAMRFGSLRRAVGRLRDHGLFDDREAEFRFMVYCIGKGAGAGDERLSDDWRDSEHHAQCKVLWRKLRQLGVADEDIDPATWDEMEERGYAPRASVGS